MCPSNHDISVGVAQAVASVASAIVAVLATLFLTRPAVDIQRQQLIQSCIAGVSSLDNRAYKDVTLDYLDRLLTKDVDNEIFVPMLCAILQSSEQNEESSRVASSILMRRDKAAYEKVKAELDTARWKSAPIGRGPENENKNKFREAIYGQYVYIQYVGASNELAADLMNLFNKNSLNCLGAERVLKANFSTEVRYFHVQDKDKALLIAKETSKFLLMKRHDFGDVRAVFIGDKYKKAPHGQIEVWINGKH